MPLRRMSVLVLSFLACSGVLSLFALVPALIRRYATQGPKPSARSMVVDNLIAVGISLVITLAITFAMVRFGFVESQFYRPSSVDYEGHTKQGLVPEDLFFGSEDGVELHGWMIPAEGEPEGTVIHFHGSDRNITSTVGNSAWLTQHGFNLFVFDYRGYGKSEGEPSRAGMVDDAVAAINYVRSLPDSVTTDDLFLWGQSMGGQLAIVAADVAGTENVRAVVAEATYASYSHQVKDKMAQMGPLWLLQWSMWLMTPDDYAARDHAGNLAPVPLLLIHGTADRAVMPYQSEWLYEAAGEPRYIWRVEDAGHLHVLRDEAYQEKLISFLKVL